MRTSRLTLSDIFAKVSSVCPEDELTHPRARSWRQLQPTPRRPWIYLTICVAVTLAAAAWLGDSGIGKPSGFLKSIPVTTVNISESNSLMSITTWRIVGAFPIGNHVETYSNSAESDALLHDFLADAHGSEVPFIVPRTETRVPIDFGLDIYDDVTLSGSRTGSFLNQNQDFPSGIVPSQALFWHTFQTFKILYAATVLYSSREQNVTLLLSGNSPVKAWLNEQLIIDPRSGSVGHDTDVRNIVLIHLHPGRNLLLLKEFCFPLRNNFVVRIATRRGASSFVDSHTGLLDVLDRVLIDRDGSALLSDNLLFFSRSQFDAYQIEIRNIENQVVRAYSLAPHRHAEVSVSGLPDGEYSVRVRVGDRSFGEKIFIGSLAFLSDRYGRLCRQHLSHRQGYDPCVMRGPLVAMISAAGAARRLDRDEPILLLISQFEWQLHRITPGTTDDEPPRFHLAAYRSPGDKQLHFYYLHLPRGYSKLNPVPLVLALGSHPDRHPFLMSGPTTAIDALRRYAFQADKFGFAVAVPFLRGDHDDSLARVDALGALNEVERHYSIDRARVYVTGDCEAGRAAVLYAERYPDLFAAVAAGRAATGVDAASGNYWDDVNNPLLYISNLRDVPVRLVHGDYFPHSPTVQAIRFREESDRIGKQVDVVILPRDGELAVEDMMALEFSFFRDKKRGLPPTAVEFKTRRLAFNRRAWLEIAKLQRYTDPATVKAHLEYPNRIDITTTNVSDVSVLRRKLPETYRNQKQMIVVINGKAYRYSTKGRAIINVSARRPPQFVGKSHSLEGPISDILLKRCTIVRGSAGAKWEREQALELTRGLGRAELAKSSLRPQAILDVDADPQILRTSNIVFVGKVRPSTAARRLRDLIPLHISQDQAMVGAQAVTTGHFVIAAVYPNPWNRRRYILLLDFNGQGRLPPIDIASLHHDVTVWSLQDQADPIEVEDWYWDVDWLHLIPADPVLP